VVPNPTISVYPAWQALLLPEQGLKEVSDKQEYIHHTACEKYMQFD
jgi:hypothetical protein